jgi:phosphohistidine phosphatase
VLLLLARHADAGVPDPARWPSDADRPLTDLGRATQRRISERIRDAGWSPSAIISSPVLRARQTAEIIAQVCGITAGVVTDEAIVDRSRPGQDRATWQPDLVRVAKAIAAFADAPTIALTGHSPWMEECASLLLAGSAGLLRTEFSKSAIMVVRAEAIAPASGELVAFLQP